MAPLKQEFLEEQKFDQWWLWVLLIAAYLSPFLINIQNILNNGFWETFGKGILAHIITLGLIIVLFLFLKLKTRISDNRIYLHYFPLFKKDFLFQDIAKSEIITYNIWQTGGWGIRLWTRFGTAYNVRGNKGLFIELKNGKKYLIGTQQPEQLKHFLSTINNN